MVNQTASSYETPLVAFDPQARYAALDERVTNLRSSLVNLEGEMRSGFTSLQSAVNSLARDLSTSQKTPWPVIWTAVGVGFSVVVAICSLAYLPIQQRTTSIEKDVENLELSTISQEELDIHIANYRDERVQLAQIIRDLQLNTVPRGEWGERTETVNASIERLNRRVDEIRQDIGDTYGVRDVIQDLKQEILRLENQIQDISSPNSSVIGN